MKSDSEVEQEAIDGIQKQLDVQWSTNWSSLPPEAEGHVEQAFTHLTRARDIVEDQE